MTEITPQLGIALMMNNYLHDVATALLIGSAAAIFVMARVVGVVNEPAATLFFLTACRRLTRLFHWALIWIVVGGIPRTIYYTRFEWANAAGKGQVTALIIKHVVMTVLVVVGIICWRRLRQLTASLTLALPPEYRQRLEE